MKKNAIVLIDFALAAERTEGKKSYDSIVEASLLRFRDPDDDGGRAAWGAASGAGHRHRLELRRPLGITIIGRLIAEALRHI